ncbi:hypothetical protein V1336_003896 [Vibrio alginolyticus]|nr:hypothetical protein [Vibrio alginolyticus]EME9804047.1 hypothetical protein [Vibrio alginolyticus]
MNTKALSYCSVEQAVKNIGLTTSEPLESVCAAELLATIIGTVIIKAAFAAVLVVLVDALIGVAGRTGAGATRTGIGATRTGVTTGAECAWKSVQQGRR